MIRFRPMVLAAALVVSAAAPTRAQGEPAASGPKTVDSFADLRTQVLDAISGATKRIWVVSDYLTDGEIVSALYVAQYRKIDVQVLLGRARANMYMSRLNYLKNQNIPTYLKPDSFKPGAPSALLCDDKLLLIDGDLDFLAKVRKYKLTTGTPDEKDKFAAAYAEAAGVKLPANAHPVPLVGKASGKGRVYSGSGSVSSGGATLPVPTGYTGPQGTDATGAYTYSRSPQPKPEGVPAKLPKGLKWEQAQKQKKSGTQGQSDDNVPELPAEQKAD